MALATAAAIQLVLQRPCAKCDDSSTPREMRNEFCIKKGYCPEGFIDFYGDCNSCSDSYSVSATEAECAKCDSTDTPRVLLENGYCALESCGAKQFQITTGECYSCSTSSSWLATADECAKCDSTDTPRVLLENGSCALESCGANRFRDTYGSCHSCSTSYGVSATTAAECAKCDKTGTPRYMNGSWCYNCPTSLSSGSLNTQEKCQSCRGTWNAETKKCS